MFRNCLKRRKEQFTVEDPVILFIIIIIYYYMHTVYISTSLCGLRLKIQDAYSKRSLLLAMFILTS